jgi:hypothetical protein
MHELHLIKEPEAAALCILRDLELGQKVMRVKISYQMNTLSKT